MPLSRAVDFTIQILRGLEHAHAQGVIHRDLKPENVFVTYDHDGRELLKLVDFGLAKLVSGEGADDGMTRAGMVFGTPRYMSPEQGAGGQIDERTDVYATGVILYEMLSGRTPFDSDDVVDLIRQHITAPVPPLPEHIPASLRDVVERMLAKSRDVRYPDAASARAALELVRPQLVERVQVPEVRSATMAHGSMFLSLSDVVRTSLPRLQQAASGRRRWMYGAAAGLAGLLFVVWIAGDDDDTAKKGGTAVAQPKKEASWIDRVVGTPKVSDEELAAVDTLIEKKALDEALTQIRNLLDRYPEDWKLRVRKARALVRQGKLAEALDAWGEAIDHGSIEILEDEALAAELTLLLEEDKVREPALTLAIRKLGAKGTPFLVSLLNRDADVLSYSDRHRALAALEQHGGSTELNVPLNRALDLWQAGDAKQPCTAFADGLAAIDDEPDPYYLGTLHAVTPPKSDANSPDPTCDSLPNDLQTVRNNLLKRYPDVPKSQWAVPKAYKKRRRRRGLFRRLFN
jgi:tetratricopeptide (TPR) repeat protein